MLHGLLGIVVAWLLYFFVPGDVYPKAPFVAAMVGLMAVWWIFEVVPIPITSLFPLIFLPLFNVADPTTVGAFYGRPIIFLFLGGFILAMGLQQSGIHKRIALRIIYLIGSKPSLVVLGFMISSGFLSMWISNTASVMVMLPIALSVIESAKENKIPAAMITSFSVCIMLGIAYAADIGGMATIIGTPPNLVFIELYGQLFPAGPEVGFLEWMLMGLPLSFLFMTFGWLLLTRFIFRLPTQHLFEGRSVVRSHMKELGPVRRDEIFAGLIFLTAALLWMTGSDIQLGESFTMHGWRSAFGLQKVTDPVIAVAVASLLFMIPSKDRQGEALLLWKEARRLPWGILLLFGGGFAIAGGFEISGLSKIVGGVFSRMDVQSPLVVVAIINTAMTFLTELTSNTAMTNLVLPVLANAAVVLEMDPRLIMVPATLSASCAFMMPIASPTQAIVFGSGYVSIRQMIRAGIWFNLLGIFLVTFIFMLLGYFILGIQLEGAPAWAR